MAMSNPLCRYAVLKFWADGVPTITFQSDPEQFASSDAGEIGKVVFAELTNRFDYTVAGKAAESDYRDESLRLVFMLDQVTALEERVRGVTRKLAQEEAVAILSEKVMAQALEAFRKEDDEELAQQFCDFAQVGCSRVSVSVQWPLKGCVAKCPATREPPKALMT